MLPDGAFLCNRHARPVKMTRRCAGGTESQKSRPAHWALRSNKPVGPDCRKQAQDQVCHQLLQPWSESLDRGIASFPCGI